jgi:hypothetical protein
MYPGKTIVMFSGEDDDYEWYGDALLEPSGKGFIVVAMCTHIAWMDTRTFPNDHPGVIEHIKTLLKTEHVEPMVGEQNRTGLLTEQYGEYHPTLCL